MTEKQIVKMALDVQNACNLSGVVHSYAKVLSALRELPICQGNVWLHSHPAAVLFADKIASLTDVQNLGCDVVMEAYTKAYKIMDSKKEDEKCPDAFVTSGSN